MKTNFAYIDDVMDRAIDAEHAAPNIPDADRADATKKAKKLIGGFRVHDHDAERKSLDDLIAKRRAGIEKFRADRDTIRDQLAAVGVTPLAVCPTGAWHKICLDAGLFILSPDSQNRVGISRKAFEGYTGKSAERNLDSYALAHWPEMLKLMFPEGRSLSDGVKATLILPDPPADVAETLCKAQRFTLTVAAVGDAIRFAEKPSELMKAANTNPKDLWAQEQGYEDYADWIKRDPIIFTEHESATAIIAQFGDFPIEQEVVDAVVKADGLLPKKPQIVTDAATDWLSYNAIDDTYQSYVRQAMADQQRQYERQRGLSMDAGAARGLYGRLFRT
ncbi:MAG: hypothetical protein JWR80_10036 [Bradyrhizobium sp.]|nr:hypothetical protein [Bradyrhizobium sp.]